MIILSGVLVVLAIALLVTGIVTGNTGHELLGLDGLKLIYVSIGVSIVSALFLAVGVFLRRKELFGTAPAPAAKATGGRTSTRPVKAKARVGAGDDAPAIPATFATATDVPAETTVYVVPGRKRYHLETCRQLAGRDKEELTFLEAREEGFTPCTACLPDTALAARAALTDTEPPTRRPDDIAESPVEVTRTDIPAARPPAERPSLATRDDIREPGRTRELPAESPAPATDTTAEPATAGTAVPEAAVPDETIAAEPPVERPRRRSMFEPLARSTAEPSTEPAAERAPSSGRDDATAEPADTASADATADIASRDATETAQDEARTDTGEAAARRTVTGAESADEAADVATEDDAAPGRTRVTETAADDTAGAGGTPTAPAGDRTGDETHPEDTADTPDEREPAGAAGSLAAPEREPATSDAAGAESPETAGADDAETAGRDAAADDAAEDEAAQHEAAEDEAEHAAADHDDLDGDSAEDDTAATDTDAATVTAAEDDTAASVSETEHAADDDTGDEAPAEPSGPVVRVLSGTKRYHRPGCALIEGISDDADDLETLSRAEAKDRGCTPCLVCQPDDD